MNNKLLNLSPKNLFSLFLGIITIIIISCEQDPSSLGSNLLPTSIGYRYDTSITFIANVYEQDAFLTSNRSNYSLGILEDEHFGTLKSEYLGQFLPTRFPEYTMVGKNVDSAFLYLSIDSLYGNPKEGIYFEVYELLQEIEDDAGYYSNTDISSFYTNENLIGSQGEFRGDSLYVIPLDSSFYNKLTLEDSTVYDTITNYLDKFHGIDIHPSIINETGGIIYANIQSSDTKIVLHYNDSVTYNYKLSTGHRFAKYTNDYSTSIANTYLQNPEDQSDDLIYLQGVAGLKSKLTFDNIEPWFNGDSTYSILNAELFVPVFKDGNFDLFYPPTNMVLLYEYADSSYATVVDYNEPVFDGTYNKENAYYRFFIPKHLMMILNGKIEDLTLYLEISSKRLPHRVILNSEDIKLKVTYTKH